MKKRVADIIMDILVENGITDCFAVVGGGAMHIDNALALKDEINTVFCHHEQACAMAAEGYSKATGKLALVSVTSGPGALNTFNGVQGAWVDSVPMLVIAGFPRYDTSIEPTGLELRCRGVQEFDAVSAVKGFTKYAKLIKNPLLIKRELQKAIDISLSGRKGPVWLSIPLDVQSATIDINELADIDNDDYKDDECLELNDKIINVLNEEIAKSEYPCILTGSGIRSSNSIDIFRDWVIKLDIPIVGGALQSDILYEGFPKYYGMSGGIGPRKGNFILHKADLIIVLGNSLPTKQTGFNQDLFAPRARIVMIDVDENEMKKPGLHVNVSICCDLNKFLKDSNGKIEPWIINKEWIDYCDSLDAYIGDIDFPKYKDESEKVSYKSVTIEGLKYFKDDVAIVLGNSNGAAGFLQNDVKTKNQRLFVNYNTGSMGDDITQSIGVAIALKKEVICITGDGSIMMNLQELQTISHYNLPVKVIIMSNNGYGALRQTYKNFFNGVYIGCDSNSGVSFPKFSDVAKTFGFDYDCVEMIGELSDKLKKFVDSNHRMILEIMQKFDDPILPKVMSKMNEKGEFDTPALQDMYPFLPEEIVNKIK